MNRQGVGDNESNGEDDPRMKDLVSSKSLGQPKVMTRHRINEKWTYWLAGKESTASEWHNYHNFDITTSHGNFVVNFDNVGNASVGLMIRPLSTEMLLVLLSFCVWLIFGGGKSFGQTTSRVHVKCEWLLACACIYDIHEIWAVHIWFYEEPEWIR
jgi:hypothetical protein